MNNTIFIRKKITNNRGHYSWLKVLPPVIVGIFLAAPMAAIMSSIDSMLIQASSTIIKDLYLAFRPKAIENEPKLKTFSTLTTLGLTIIVFLLAFNPPDMLIWLNLLSLGGLEATFLWVIVLGLYWKNANATGAIFSMVVGLGSYLLMAGLQINFFNFHSIIPSLLFGLIAFGIGNKVGKK